MALVAVQPAVDDVADSVVGGPLATRTRPVDGRGLQLGNAVERAAQLGAQLVQAIGQVGVDLGQLGAQLGRRVLLGASWTGAGAVLAGVLLVVVMCPP
jgi:hypothetical protein